MKEQLLDPTAPWAQTLRDNFRAFCADKKEQWPESVMSTELDAYVPRFLLWLAFGRPDMQVLWIPRMWREYHAACRHSGAYQDCVTCATERTQDPFDQWLLEQLKGNTNGQ